MEDTNRCVRYWHNSTYNHTERKSSFAVTIYKQGGETLRNITSKRDKEIITLIGLEDNS